MSNLLGHNGGPAFAHGNPYYGGDPGMSLRDWFAGQALAAVENPWAMHPKNIARECYRIADAMLAAREERQAAFDEMLAALENLENDDGNAMPPSAWDMVQKAIARAKGVV